MHNLIPKEPMKESDPDFILNQIEPLKVDLKFLGIDIKNLEQEYNKTGNTENTRYHEKWLVRSFIEGVANNTFKPREAKQMANILLEQIRR